MAGDETTLLMTIMAVATMATRWQVMVDKFFHFFRVCMGKGFEDEFSDNNYNLSFSVKNVLATGGREIIACTKTIWNGLYDVRPPSSIPVFRVISLASSAKVVSKLRQM
jgi:hypothetical protein